MLITTTPRYWRWKCGCALGQAGTYATKDAIAKRKVCPQCGKAYKRDKSL